MLWELARKKTPEAFRNACDEFVYLENLSKDTDNQPARPGNRSASGSRRDSDGADDRHKGEDLREIHKLLRIAWDKYQDDDRYVNVSSAGQYIKRAKPDFDARTYGYVKLPDLIEAFPKRYAMKRYPGKGTVTIIAYQMYLIYILFSSVVFNRRYFRKIDQSVQTTLIPAAMDSAYCTVRLP